MVILSLLTFPAMAVAQPNEVPEPEGIMRWNVEVASIDGMLELLRFGRSYDARDQQERLGLLGFKHLKDVPYVDPGLIKLKLYGNEDGIQDTFGPFPQYDKIAVIMISRNFAAKNNLKNSDHDFELLKYVEIQLETVDILLSYLQRISEMTREESLRFHPSFRIEVIRLIRDEVEHRLEDVKFPKPAVKRIYGNFVAALAHSAIENVPSGYTMLVKIVEDRMYHLMALDISRPLSFGERCGKKFGAIAAKMRGSL